MKQYNTYVFDLDGTLLSTLDDLAASTNYALRTHLCLSTASTTFAASLATV